MQVVRNAKDSLTFKTKMLRVLWELLKPIFYHSPRIMWGFRTTLLRLCGAKVGKHIHIANHVNIKFPWNLEIGNHVGIGEDTYLYSWAKITIQDHTIISHKCQLCSGTHDCFDKDFPVVLSPITICSGSWICTEAFIGPGVKVGEYSVVSARAVLLNNSKPWGIYVGNPAKRIGFRSFDAE